MKKIILIFAFIINVGYICLAQGEGSRASKVEAVQIAFLTKELDLSPEEAQRFWPVFNNYKQEIITARKQHTAEIELEENILNVRKKYQGEFKKVLGSDQRVNKLFQADKNFKEMLRKELMERRAQRGGKFKN